jgi:DnaJ-class molecular chaperone
MNGKVINGNYYVRCTIKLPDKLSAKEKKLFKELAELNK